MVFSPQGAQPRIVDGSGSIAGRSVRRIRAMNLTKDLGCTPAKNMCDDDAYLNYLRQAFEIAG